MMNKQFEKPKTSRKTASLKSRNKPKTQQRTSGKMARTTLHRGSGLSDEEIAREAEWVRKLRIQ